MCHLTVVFWASASAPLPGQSADDEWILLSAHVTGDLGADIYAVRSDGTGLVQRERLVAFLGALAGVEHMPDLAGCCVDGDPGRRAGGMVGQCEREAQGGQKRLLGTRGELPSNDLVEPDAQEVGSYPPGLALIHGALLGRPTGPLLRGVWWRIARRCCGRRRR